MGLALFDLDGTLVGADTDWLFVRHLQRRRKLPLAIATAANTHLPLLSAVAYPVAVDPDRRLRRLARRRGWPIPILGNPCVAARPPVSRAQ